MALAAAVACASDVAAVAPAGGAGAWSRLLAFVWPLDDPGYRNRCFPALMLPAPPIFSVTIPEDL